MSTKEPNLPAHDEVKPSGPLSKVALSRLWQEIHVTTTEAYASLREDLNRALNEYRLDHQTKAEAALRALVTYLNSAAAKGIRDSFEAKQLAAVRAAAHSVLGRVYERLHRDNEAIEYYNWSVQLYDELRSKQQDEALTPPDYRDLGIALFKLNRFDEALYILETAIQRGDQSAETNSYIGNVLQQRGDKQAAQSYFRRAVELNPDDVTANVALAENLEALGQSSEATNSYLKAAFLNAQQEQWDEALNLIERCNRLSPGDGKVVRFNAELLRLIERYDEALQAINQFLDIQPNDALALGLKGQILRALNRYDEAVEVLERAIKANSELAWVHAELGEDLRVLGRYEEAVYAFNTALISEPDNLLAREGVSASLVMLGDYDEALKLLDQLLEEDQENDFAWAYKGEALRLEEKYEEALDALAHALDLAPDDPFALGTKGQILRALNKPQEAIEVLKRTIAVDPSLGWAHGELGEALRLLGRNKEALDAINAALELEPDNALLLGTKGAVLYALLQYPGALEALNESLKALPNYSWAYSLKGAVLCDLGAFSEALETLKNIADDDPPHLRSYSLLLRGWTLENLGNDHAIEAKDAYVAALELDPDNLWSKKGIANALYVIDEKAKQEAKVIYDEILTKLNSLKEEDAPSMALKGWCLYRVGQFNDSMRRLVDALSLDPRIIYAQFDLALVSLESQRYALGVREYERGLDLLKTEYVLRRRGLLHVALRDLKIAMDQNKSLQAAEEAQAVRQLMEEEFNKIQQEAVGGQAMSL